MDAIILYWIIAIILFNWIGMFLIGAGVAFLFTRFAGCYTHSIKDGVLYCVMQENCWLRKVTYRLSKHARNFSFGTVVYFHSDMLNGRGLFKNSYIFDKLEKHERRHVAQQCVFGIIQWLTYVLFHVIGGYSNNPYETDARKAENK